MSATVVSVTQAPSRPCGTMTASDMGYADATLPTQAEFVRLRPQTLLVIRYTVAAHNVATVRRKTSHPHVNPHRTRTHAAHRTAAIAPQPSQYRRTDQRSCHRRPSKCTLQCRILKSRLPSPFQTLRKDAAGNPESERGRREHGEWNRGTKPKSARHSHCLKRRCKSHTRSRLTITTGKHQTAPNPHRHFKVHCTSIN